MECMHARHMYVQGLCQCDGYNMYTVKLHKNAKDSYGQYGPLRQWHVLSDMSDGVSELGWWYGWCNGVLQ